MKTTDKKIGCFKAAPRFLFASLAACILLNSCGVVTKLDSSDTGSSSLPSQDTSSLASEQVSEPESSSQLISDAPVSEPESLTPLAEENFAAAFQNSVVVGDSITEGVAAYQVLPEANVVYERGANMEHVDPLIQSTIAKAPTNIFLSFGINDLVIYGSNSDPYIEAYQEAVKTLQSSLPDAKIYVNSIVPMAENAIAKQSSLQYYSQYNTELQKMCQELDVTFVDVTDILTQQPELHEPDGIHVSRQYYILWMQRLAQVAGLTA